jgi:hypothetical protein
MLFLLRFHLSHQDRMVNAGRRPKAFRLSVAPCLLDCGNGVAAAEAVRQVLAVGVDRLEALGWEVQRPRLLDLSDSEDPNVD